MGKLLHTLKLSQLHHFLLIGRVLGDRDVVLVAEALSHLLALAPIELVHHVRKLELLNVFVVLELCFKLQVLFGHLEELIFNLVQLVLQVLVLLAHSLMPDVLVSDLGVQVGYVQVDISDGLKVLFAIGFGLVELPR